MGIDVSKATLDISVRGKHIKINNSRAAINSFINGQLAGVDIRLCVLESTGGYERLVITMLNEANIPVHRAHPNKVYAFAKACGHFAKTDKLDSKLLEKYAEFIKDKNVVCIELTKELIDLQGLRAVQKNLERELHANQCRAKLLSGKAVDYIKEEIEFNKKQLGSIENDIEELICRNKELRKKQQTLISYKGIGKKIANSLIAELPELGSLSNKEVASLVGVAPKTNESGKKVWKGHISGGRFFVRKTLYMAALVAAFSNDKLTLRKRIIFS